MYKKDLAEIYDALYEGRGKDYSKESNDIAELILKNAPNAVSLLDVACGTGSHLRYFVRLFEHAEGLELSKDMLAVAAERLPGTPLHQGDMRDFSIDSTFDAVTCMFSSIGHMGTQEELDAALSRMVRHLNPGGVIVIEPWWFPETFLPNYVAGDVVTVRERTLARVSHSVLEEGRTRMEVHYIIAESGDGVRHFNETHFITLFSRKQYESAFKKVGCGVEYIDGGPSGRGLFVGTYG